MNKPEVFLSAFDGTFDKETSELVSSDAASVALRSLATAPAATLAAGRMVSVTRKAPPLAAGASAVSSKRAGRTLRKAAALARYVERFARNVA